MRSKKMNLCLFCVVLLLTLQCVKGAENFYTLQPNVVVVVPMQGSSVVQVPLLCGESYAHLDIVWRIKGLQVARGNQVNVTVEEMLGGNYTCHDHTGELLNHTLVLVQADRKRILEKSNDSEYVHCLSKNYSGVFQCYWEWSQTRKGDVLLVTAARSSAEITCSLDPTGHSITCRDHAYCPYSEERERITLMLYVKNQFRMEMYTKPFFITEIVKPDRITLTEVAKNTFELGYPDTWNTPESYFPLTFQVKVVPQKRTCGCECSKEPKKTESQLWQVKKGFLMCVRAQDALCRSAWSDWSHTNENHPGTSNITLDQWHRTREKKN
ncbi:hypothetical protein SKAU_G00366060 [Synaphobranchus kaupii]|uniref:Interleukin-12 subunit beta n=1 Tax=Synaphobranchus kaupii TaxID=118154 RepID=A0A9Q1EF47_SYNKA|nr:hypothetical protein SKAU_G00366060 [Synaphobranchus kaupii]